MSPNTKPALKQPKVLFVFTRRGSESSTQFGGFARRIERFGGLKYAEADYVALEDVIFELDHGHAKVYDIRTGNDLSKYSFVYFKGWESMPDRACALAIFFQMQGIPFIDDAVVERGNPNKLVSHFRMWANGLPVIKTLYTANHNLISALSRSNLTYPVVIKSSTGQKGKDNFLAKNFAAAKKIISANSDLDLLIQEFIPNDYDLRVQIYGGKAALVIKRIGTGKSHLNNTSAGASAQLVELKDLKPNLLKLAEEAAGALHLQVAGVDIIIDKKTKAYYVLEVNQGSQVVTGKFIERNIPAFDQYLSQVVARRYEKSTADPTKPKTVIGRHTLADLPVFGITNIAAKVDTGAYYSALHAEDIRVVREKGKRVLKFKVPVFENGRSRTPHFVECRATDFDVVEIQNSFGGWQKRYKINTSVRIQGRRFKTTLTLSNRESLKTPMLLGRKLLRGNFLVNVELSRMEENL